VSQFPGLLPVIDATCTDPHFHDLSLIQQPCLAKKSIVPYCWRTMSKTKCCFYKLHTLFKIRRFLSEVATKTMVQTLTISKLDYCNSILNGLPNTTLEFLVRVQKAVARLISHKTRFQHISPVMKDLHWLPIKKRIEYKIVVLTFKSAHSLAPAYLTKLLHNRTNKGTRADNKNLLVVPKVKKSTFDGRSFSFTAPFLWNQLPNHFRHASSLEIFQRKLKTHLFTKI